MSAIEPCLRDELEPGEWISGGTVYRTEYIPARPSASGAYGFWAMIVPVRMLPWKRAQLLDPIANAKAAARLWREGRGR
jgi:hypothetical protein